ncbi:HDIG domain-containing protein [bacterium]|nr:HDIG domain-containing protein [bacterium]
MADYFNEKFEILKLINNDTIKVQVVQCWQESLKRGAWSMTDLDMIPFSLLVPDCPYSLIDHTAAVTKNAFDSAKAIQKFHEKISIDYDILIAGGLLHDVGKLLEYTKQGDKVVKSTHGKLLRHPISGANLASEMGLPHEVVHIIATHSHEGDKVYRSPESIIIHHCDFIYFEVVKAQLNVV